MTTQEQQVNASQMGRRYAITLLLSAATLLAAVLYFGWVTFQQTQARLLRDDEASGKQLQMLLNSRLDVAQNHIADMQRNMQVTLAKPQLGATSLAESLMPKTKGVATDAPWDHLEPSIRAEIGALLVDPLASIDPVAMRLSVNAILAMLPGVAAIHEREKVFQWSYFYDAQQRYLSVFPAMSRTEVLTVTQSQNFTASLKSIFDADGTQPLSLVGPLKNSQKKQVWTTPYLDAAGKGMMISLLAPVYKGDAFIGAVGTDLTLQMLDNSLSQSPLPLGRALVLDDKGMVIADSGGSLQHAKTAVALAQVLPHLAVQHLFTVPPEVFQQNADARWTVYDLEGTPWRLLVYVPTPLIKQKLLEAELPYFLLGALFFFGLLALGWVQHRRFTRPALRLVTYVDALAKNPMHPLPQVPRVWRFWFKRVSETATERHAYLSQTVQNAALLERKVEERTHELSVAYADLKQAMEGLHNTQSMLVQSEKLASLGFLVAGVAHELNTPLGNAILTASTLRDQTQQFAAAAQQPLTRSALDQHLAHTLSGADLLVKNLERAAQLVQSFKQLATNQASEQRRSFSLIELLRDIQHVMAPKLNKTPFELKFSVPEDLVLDSFPGPLSQVIINLINNALLHAFADRNAGEMHVQATKEAAKQDIHLVFSDNGRGMSAEARHQVFDPFFTTSLGTGSSGLGMHIVYNIVTKILGGSITVDSAPDAGTHWHLLLPLVAPEESPSAP